MHDGCRLISVAKLVEAIGRERVQPWCSVSGESIADALKSDTLEGVSYNADPLNFDAIRHARRIAYFIRFGWFDPIEVDVGIPSLGYCVFSMDDGYHRLNAAIWLKHKTILASVCGEFDEIEKLMPHSTERGYWASFE